MAKSSAELANWRERPEYQYNNPAVQEWLKTMGQKSQDSLGVINSMPFVFDPSKYVGKTPEELRQITRPGSGGLLQSLQQPQGQDPNNSILSLLGLLGGGGGGLAALLGGTRN